MSRLVGRGLKRTMVAAATGGLLLSTLLAPLMASPAAAVGLTPSITCPANITRGNDPNQAGAVVTYPAPTVSGGDPPVTVSASPASGSFFPVGTTTVTATATDNNGDTATCTFTIKVNDTQPPSITCPANITVDATSPSGAVVTFAPTASDNAPGVTVTANPPSGSLFPVGTTTVTATATDTSGNTATCSFSVTVRPLPTLTVTRVGTGTGRVTSTPSGINCPPDCSEQVPSGTHFMLTATPDAGSVFARWGGGGCPGTGTCDVTIYSDTLVSASFDLAPPPVGTFDLHVSKDGKGRVMSASEEINCGKACTATYDAGSMVTLTARPRSGWMLKRWRYGCSGSDLACTLEMSSNRRAKAIFVRE